MYFSSAIAVGLAPLLASAYLSGSVGPTTSVSTKSNTKICNVLDYGAKADKSTDVGAAISSAWDDCKDGGVVYIPSGDYAFETWVKLSGGSSCAIQLDGILYRTGTDGGNMIMVEHTKDFEMFSSTSKGAVQGYGYEYHKEGSSSGARILRLYDVTDFSVHDLALVDAPVFHFSLDTCENGEVYNLAIRGGDKGGLDGIDVWSTNIWIHDVSFFPFCLRGSLLTHTRSRSPTRTNVLLSRYDFRTHGSEKTTDNLIESRQKHSSRKHLLQLEWRLCHGLPWLRC